MVRLSYQDWSVEDEDHVKDLVTDKSGRVSFQREWRYSSPAHRAFGSVFNRLRNPVHFSIGRHAFVFAFTNELRGEAVFGDHHGDWTGYPSRAESTIVMKPFRSIPEDVLEKWGLGKAGGKN